MWKNGRGVLPGAGALGISSSTFSTVHGSATLTGGVKPKSKAEKCSVRLEDHVRGAVQIALTREALVPAIVIVSRAHIFC